MTNTIGKTYTLTLTENEMARVIHSLAADVASLQLLADAHQGDQTQNYAAALADASEALRARFAEVVRPLRDPTDHVSTDERWAADRNHDL